MRTRKAILNTCSSIVYQFVTVICSFILPRLILTAFGSNYNGVVSSINQFLSWISVLSAGIGGVTRAALYRPLSECDTKQISSIMKATDIFMKKIATIFVVLLLVFGSVYPCVVRNDFDFFFVFTLVLVLGISTFAQYYFGITYQTLLEADQRQYIFVVVRIVTTIVATAVAAILISYECEIRIVYLASSIVYAINPIYLNIFVKKYYQLDSSVAPDNRTVIQRWDAFAQELAIMINNNTDIIVLTTFSNIKIVSVYTIYNMIINGVKQMLQTFTTGVGAAFGSMIAQGAENDYLDKTLRIFEFVVFNITTILFTITALTIVPFVKIYVRGITDVEYSQWTFGYLITLAAMFNCFRIPYQTIVYAAGKFKETRNGSIIEASINIVLSIILVIEYGLVGVAIGTLVAAIFRTCQYAVYLSRKIIIRSRYVFMKNIVISMTVWVCNVLLLSKILSYCENPTNYIEWISTAIEVGTIVVIQMIILDIFFFRQQFRGLLGMIKKQRPCEMRKDAQ